MKTMPDTRTPLPRGTTALACFCLLLALAPSLSAQSSTEEVRSYIQKLDQAQTDEVRRALPDLITKYQNTPEILYLQGRLASDGIEAVKFYQGVVDNFPKSDYAEEALYRIYQYYNALGLYRTAEKKLAQLKSSYPASRFVSGSAPAKFPKQEEAAVTLPEKETAPVDTAAAPVKRTMPQESRKPYTLQVGAFSTLANAQKQKGVFEEMGYTAEITNKLRNGRSLHLVWVGSFGSAGEAMHFAKEMKTKYKIDSIVVEKY